MTEQNLYNTTKLRIVKGLDIIEQREEHLKQTALGIYGEGPVDTLEEALGQIAYAADEYDKDTLIMTVSLMYRELRKLKLQIQKQRIEEVQRQLDELDKVQTSISNSLLHEIEQLGAFSLDAQA